MGPSTGSRMAGLAGMAVAGLTLLLTVQAGFAQEIGGSDDTAKKVQKAFDSLYGELCRPSNGTERIEPEVHSTTFAYDSAGDAGEPQNFTLYRYHCFFGAYNETAVYLAANHYGEVQPVSFAVPVFDAIHENDNSDEAVESIRTTGFTTENLLINSEVEPDTLTIRTMSRWRGLGDASSSGTWRFHEGKFVLEAYDVDASYDGAVNPRRIYGAGTPSYGDTDD